MRSWTSAGISYVWVRYCGCPANAACAWAGATKTTVGHVTDKSTYVKAYDEVIYVRILKKCYSKGLRVSAWRKE